MAPLISNMIFEQTISRDTRKFLALYTVLMITQQTQQTGKQCFHGHHGHRPNEH